MMILVTNNIVYNRGQCSDPSYRVRCRLTEHNQQRKCVLLPLHVSQKALVLMYTTCLFSILVYNKGLLRSVLV